VLLVSDSDTGGEAPIFEAKCQTVSNLPGGRYEDTIAPGSFEMRAFVAPRNFYGRIHGLCMAYDLDGQLIDEDSVETVPGNNGAPTDFNRWLVHDWQKHRRNPDGSTNPPGTDTRVAWSAGCFVLKDADLESLGDILASMGIKPGSLIEGTLEMAT
jgi:hypothetical protein